MVIINPQNYFYVCNGAVLKDMSGLLSELKSMDDLTFLYHVNNEKNDFYNWVKEVLKDETLASKINKAKKKAEMISAVEQRLKNLNKPRNMKDKKATISEIKEAIAQNG